MEKSEYAFELVDLVYDQNKILNEMESFPFHPFNDLGPSQTGETKIPKGHWFDNPPTWLQSHCEEHKLDKNSEIKNVYEQLRNMLKTKVIKARFYKQLKNSELPMHYDMKATRCTVNIILSDDYAPITFEEYGDITYKAALLNLQKKHAVKAHPKERLLIKFSMTDIEYEDALRNYLC